MRSVPAELFYISIGKMEKVGIFFLPQTIVMIDDIGLEMWWTG